MKLTEHESRKLTGAPVPRKKLKDNIGPVRQAICNSLREFDGASFTIPDIAKMNHIVLKNTARSAMYLHIIKEIKVMVELGLLVTITEGARGRTGVYRETNSNKPHEFVNALLGFGK